jgi:hypothetical protein
MDYSSNSPPKALTSLQGAYITTQGLLQNTELGLGGEVYILYYKQNGNYHWN